MSREEKTKQRPEVRGAVSLNIMGQPFVVALERDIGVNCDIEPTLFLGSYGKTEMYHLAVQQGLTLLMLFDSSSLEDQAKFAEEDDYISENTPEQWFEASEGLTSIRGLLFCLRNNVSIPGVPNSSLPKVDEFVEAMIEALEATELVLAQAEKQNVRFHFAAVAP